MDINKRIIELENEIAILPQGSINIKKINGKEVVDAPVPTKFETSVVIGNRLLAMTKGVRNWKERDCFPR